MTIINQFLPRIPRDGDEIHYVSLLNEEGDIVATIPMRNPVVVKGCEVSIDLTVRATLKESTIAKNIES